MNEIYLDSASTTKPLPEVVEVVQKYMTDYWHNPSALYSPARKVREDIECARETIARFINAEPEQIIFTSGASESNSMFRTYDGIKITSQFEHDSSFIDSSMRSDKYNKWNNDVFLLIPDEYGFINFKKNLPSLLSENRLNSAIENGNIFDDSYLNIIVTIMMANNEIGTIQDIKKLRKDIYKYIARHFSEDKELCYEFHTDATQAFGHIPIDVKNLNIDYLSASAHKLGGLKGTGILYVKNFGSNLFNKNMIKGHQENGIRGGTENVIGIMAFAKAVEIANKNMKERTERITKIRDYMINNLESFGCRLNGSRENRLYNNINVILPNNIYGESMIHMLDTSGIYISAGSACNSNDIKPSKTLKSIGLSDEEAMRSVRITLPDDITLEQIDYALKEIDKCIKILSIE